jgi:1,4-dihydroxy-2-naphthoate octaprenyltransferase
MSTLSAYVQAARPKTLTASIAPVILGTALAHYTRASALQNQSASSSGADAYTWIPIFLCTLGAAVLLQIASNYFNDALDFEKGADTTERFGPQRVTQAGLLSSASVKRIGMSCVILAIILGIPLVMQGGIPILVIGLSAAFFSWAYTGGPYPLAYNGLGELFVLLYYGIIAVCGTYYLQVQHWDITFTVPMGIACGSFGMALIALNNFRDIHQDKQAKKKTLAVRFGERFAKICMTLFLMMPYFFLFIALNSENSKSPSSWLSLGAIMAPSLILGLFIIKQLKALQPSRSANKLLGLIALNQMVFTILTSIALLFIFL